MPSGLDMLGAGLSDSVVIVRVIKIDPNKLKQATGAERGLKSMAVSAALAATNRVPKAVLDVALPTAAGVLKDKYGIEAVITAADSYEVKDRPVSEFFPGLVAGALLGLSGLGIWKGVSRLLHRQG